MVKKKVKSVVSVVVVFAVLLCSAAAASSEIQPRWTYVSGVTGHLEISSSGFATLYGGGNAVHPDVDNVKVIVELQQFKNSKWQTVKTWTAVGEGWSTRTSTKTWPVYHGYSYRLYVTLEAYSGSTFLESGTHIENYGFFQ